MVPMATYYLVSGAVSQACHDLDRFYSNSIAKWVQYPFGFTFRTPI
ncbi:hypothetical protein OXB_0512 [Bacillus sp. OxB-1]|nr:hypothetical protein OXB_0512 [Bacillus sp. OxB-1]